MTIDRAIELLETGSRFPNTPHTSEELDETCKLAVKALRAQQEQPVEPLTLEELLTISEPTRLWTVGDHNPFYSLVEWFDTPYGRKLHWISLDGGEDYMPEKQVQELYGGPYMLYYRRKGDVEGGEPKWLST